MGASAACRKGAKKDTELVYEVDAGSSMAVVSCELKRWQRQHWQMLEIL